MVVGRLELPRCFLRPIAHRGWHDHRARRIENSAAAFEAAIAGGFGIECDVCSAAGGLPVVFHDAHAKRLLGIDAATDALREAQLSELTYADGSRVMTFAAFLALVGGRVPVLAEANAMLLLPEAARWANPVPIRWVASDRIKASFAAFDIRVLPTSVSETLRRTRGIPLFAWTVRAPTELQAANSWADAPIFEGDVVGPNTRS